MIFFAIHMYSETAESPYADYSNQHVRAQTFTEWPLASPSVDDMVQAGFIYKGIVLKHFQSYFFNLSN